MNRQVMNPDHEDGDVDWKDAEHEDEDGVGVVVEIIVGFVSLERICQCMVGGSANEEELTFSRT